MSSAGVAPQLTSKLKDGTATTLPIRVNSTPLAQATAQLIPALQLGLFLVRFKDLVADPVSTLSSSLPLVLLLQITYALVCLPAAGSQTAKPTKKPSRGEKKKAGAESSGPNVFVASFLSLLLTAFTTPFLHVVIILFGAPALNYVPQTALCAAHLAALAFFPLFYAHGVDGTAWTAVATARAPLDETFGGLLGAVVGAWLGAVPIPLDWDREWQRWPVTILCGLYGGYVLGKLIGGTLGFGKRFGAS